MDYLLIRIVNRLMKRKVSVAAGLAGSALASLLVCFWLVLPVGGGAVRFLFQAAAAAVLVPVSYTHLDVYKRQVIGTVKGDLHDIGKNLVIMMLKGAGFEIYDIGVDVEASAFADKAEEVGADIIGMSALLTTTMPNMQEVMDVLKERGIRDKYIVMIGGAPVNESFAQQIGADYYTPVSYTHLDVYKRQPRIWESQFTIVCR